MIMRVAVEKSASVPQRKSLPLVASPCVAPRLPGNGARVAVTVIGASSAKGARLSVTVTVAVAAAASPSTGSAMLESRGAILALMAAGVPPSVMVKV